MQLPNELERDVRALAEILIGRYGERAVSYASYQALKAQYRGEAKTTEAWRWIGAAVGQVLRAEPDFEGAVPQLAPHTTAARAATTQSEGATRRIARLFAPEQAYES